MTPSSAAHTGAAAAINSAAAATHLNAIRLCMFASSSKTAAYELYSRLICSALQVMNPGFLGVARRLFYAFYAILK
jgi:hypothetical protein